MTDVRWIREYATDGRVLLRWGRIGNDLVAEWPRFGRLRASRSGETFDFQPHAAADPVVVQKFFRGLVSAMIRHLRGQHTLHGSCVARGGRAVVLLGGPGDGKSSLAEALCRRDGVCLVADDTAWVECAAGASASALPTEDVCWLHGEALMAAGGSVTGGKVPLAVPRCASGPSEVAALVRLRWGDAERPTLRRVRGACTFDLLARAQFRFVLDEPDVDVGDFEFTARLADSVPMYELTRPRKIELIGAAADLALELLEARQLSAGEAT